LRDLHRIGRRFFARAGLFDRALSSRRWWSKFKTWGIGIGTVALLVLGFVFCFMMN
jgi:hypothetical protein